MATEQLKALVVDDSGIDRRIVRTILERRGVDVSSQTTVSGAIAALSAGNYDVVVLDFQLPDGNGGDIYSWLCRMSQQMCHRTVVMTGRPVEDVRRYFSADTIILHKPVARAELDEALDAAMMLSSVG